MKRTPMFFARSDGFAITFANGWTVSVRHGSFHYCDNKDRDQTKEWNCPNAEVAVLMPDGEFDGDVKGWQTPDQVAAIITKTAEREY